MAAMDIRRLGPSDAPAFRALRLRALREHPEAFTSSHEEDEQLAIATTEQRLSAGGSTRFWGAFDGAEMRGMVGLEREQRIKNAHKAQVVAMYVAPEAGRRGIGAALIDRLVGEARADGVASLVLTVTDGNHSATALYQRAGFRSFGIEPDAVRVGGRSFAENHMHLGLS